MCGIVGIFHKSSDQNIDRELLISMTKTIGHRGPDDDSYLTERNLGLGFCRLSIVDIAGGQQPMFNEDRTLSMICNGEIFNYRELRNELVSKGHQFASNCDVEVLVHLYEEYGPSFLNRLNGQFAFAIHDSRTNQLLLARDHTGIVPLFYTFHDETLIFASEIKAILKYPGVRRSVNLLGLDQMLTFPGNASPTTMFEGINSLQAGHYLQVTNGNAQLTQYWDLDYPVQADENEGNEELFTEELIHVLNEAVKCRLQADVPVGYYLSGGLDSSLIASLVQHNAPGKIHDSFSIAFPQKGYDERKYQQLMVDRLGSNHKEKIFHTSEIEKRLEEVIYHSESPLKESYNTCNMALSETVRANNVKVVLSGEGADELFGGYVGYRFDGIGERGFENLSDLERVEEQELRTKVWGDHGFLYERHFRLFEETKNYLYAAPLKEKYSSFSSLRSNLIDRGKLAGRSDFHKRSYVDFKLRLSDHLIADHGDRMAYANSVEARYPFLDIRLLELVRRMPGSLKMKGMQEKYILKKGAAKYLPKEIINREKFSYVAPGSPFLLKEGSEMIQDILSIETIKKQGYFNPDVVEHLKKQYLAQDFDLNQTFEIDLLFFILTFGLFLEKFKMPNHC